MEIRTGPLYSPLRTLIVNQPAPPDKAIPGLLVGLDAMVRHNPEIYRSIAENYKFNIGTPCLVVSPAEVPALFTDEELGLLKKLGGMIAENLDPKLRLGYDTAWLLYDAFQISNDFQRLGEDKMASFFRIADFSLGFANLLGKIDSDLKIPDSLAGGMSLVKEVGKAYRGKTAPELTPYTVPLKAYPGLQIPDRWANGFNFIVRDGDKAFQGRTPVVDETIVSSDERHAIVSKCMLVGSAALDPDPKFKAIHPILLGLRDKTS